MVEAGANEVPEDKILEAIMFGHKEIQKIVEFQENIVAKLKRKMKLELYQIDKEIESAIRKFCRRKLINAVKNSINYQGR